MEVTYRDELYHHGILGQRWGKRNGPPYPLDAKSHSSSERKAGWRKSLAGSGVDSQNNKTYNFKKLTPEQRKKLIKIGASAAVGVLVVGGAIYLSKNGNFDNLRSIGMKNVESVFGKIYDNKVGKSFDEIDQKMVKSINHKNKNSIGGRINCTHTSLSYILNSVFGMNTTALPFSGIDETSGLKLEGRDIGIYNSIFDNLDTRKCYENETMFDMFRSLKPGSTGILGIRVGPNKHVLNYEKTLDGAVTVIDAQTNSITGISEYVSSGRYSPYIVIDCSNATLKDGADKILKNMVGGY